MKVATKRSKNENKKESIEQKEQINTTQSERSTEEKSIVHRIANKLLYILKNNIIFIKWKMKFTCLIQ